MQDTGRFTLTSTPVYASTYTISTTWLGGTSCEALTRKKTCENPLDEACECPKSTGMGTTSDMSGSGVGPNTQVTIGVAIGAGLIVLIACMRVCLCVCTHDKKPKESHGERARDAARRISRRLSAYATLMISRLPGNATADQPYITRLPSTEKDPFICSLPSNATVPFTTNPTVVNVEKDTATASISRLPSAEGPLKSHCGHMPDVTHARRNGHAHNYDNGRFAAGLLQCAREPPRLQHADDFLAKNPDYHC
jgi:hypothetical protein